VKNKYRIDLAEHRVEIPDLPAELEGLRVVHFSDLHGPKPVAFLRRANALLRQARGDLLVTTGDVLDHGHWLSVARRQLPVLLEGVNAPLGFFGVLGNHDRLEIVPLLESLGMTVLVNRWAEVRVGHAALKIGGAYARRLHEFPAVLRRFAATVPKEGPTIVLAHLPSAIWVCSRARVNLVLAGHTHAGQWRFGRLGCLWTHDDIPRELAGGLHKVKDTYLYVTAGLGESGPIPVRLWCPPEVAVLTLHRARTRAC
jgi:predicted MPP superfamily phosphohydrolase